jgi:hypothetical protein
MQSDARRIFAAGAYSFPQGALIGARRMFSSWSGGIRRQQYPTDGSDNRPVLNESLLQHDSDVRYNRCNVYGIVVPYVRNDFYHGGKNRDF